MSEMAQMCKAIRLQVEKHGTLREVPTEVLKDYVTIITAFELDMREELARRES